jgi:hypothetical protein
VVKTRYDERRTKVRQQCGHWGCFSLTSRACCAARSAA